MPLIMTAVQQCTYSITFEDKLGNPATVEGVPTWTVSDPAILTLEAHPSGMSALVKAAGPTGNAQVLVQADADLGAGTVLIQGLDDVQVIAAQAVGVALTPGTPEDQPLPEAERAARQAPRA